MFIWVGKHLGMYMYLWKINQFPLVAFCSLKTTSL